MRKLLIPVFGLALLLTGCVSGKVAEGITTKNVSVRLFRIREQLKQMSNN